LEDLDLAVISLFEGLGVSVISMFFFIAVFPSMSGFINIGLASFLGFLTGAGNFFLVKKRETGYFKVPQELLELHCEVEEIENPKVKKI